MPISNSTEERVGVEVSGPTSNARKQISYVLLAAGVALIITGLVLGQSGLVAAGVALVIAGAVLLRQARRKASQPASMASLQPRKEQEPEFPTVLEPNETLDDPDEFHNRIVKFFEVDAANTQGAPIATIDFSSGEYQVVYHQNGEPKEIPPQKIIPSPILIDLAKSASGPYQVNVQTEG